MKYIIAAGGTGMKCLEAFVHLCAIGMFDNESFRILLIDTDVENGNLLRTQNVIKAYQTIKGNGNPTGDGFFSAKIEPYEFICKYELGDSFKSVVRGGSSAKDEKLQIVLDMFADRDTQGDANESGSGFKLNHGYRTQTHIGSYLMYHAITDTYRKKQQGLKIQDERKGGMEFIDNLISDSEEKKIFVFGSIFGGTGASTLPIIPKAFFKCEDIKRGDDGHRALRADDITWGATLITDYFSFNDAKDAQKKKQKVIANAGEFSLNSQAALQYYEDDKMVENLYKRFYILGWGDTAFDVGSKGDEVLTGGRNQKNNAHPVELLAAAAAYDFFNQADYNHKYYHRTIDTNPTTTKLEINENSFFNQGADAMKFKQKLLSFAGFCGMVRTHKIGGLTQFLTYIKDDKGMMQHLEGIRIADISKEQIKAVDNYIDYFSFERKGETKIVEEKTFGFFSKKKEITVDIITSGWLQQLWQSGNIGFLFTEQAQLFDTDYNVIETVAWDKLSAQNTDYTSSLDRFIRKFTNIERGNIGTSPLENLLFHLYLTFVQTNNFN